MSVVVIQKYASTTHVAHQDSHTIHVSPLCAAAVNRSLGVVFGRCADERRRMTSQSCEQVTPSTGTVMVARAGQLRVG